MKFAVIALALCVVGTAPAPASAAGHVAQASAVAHVQVTVAPTVSQSTSTVTVETTAGGANSQGLQYAAAIDFRVSVNQPEVAFRVTASPLYFAGDPANIAISPIPLDPGAGVRIEPSSASPAQGHTNLAAFLPGPGPIVNGFPTLQTQTVPFTASQPVFSQNVTVRITWTPATSFHPVGQYSGVVQLTTLLLPPGP